MRFLIFAFALILSACSEPPEQKQEPQTPLASEPKKTEPTQEDIENAGKSPREIELKNSLKSRLNNLSDNLSKQNLDALSHELKPHTNAANKGAESLQKALELQSQNIENLRQKNDEISR